MSSIFNKIKKITENENAFILNEDNPYKVCNWIDTGCYALNAILSDGDILKGIPDGKRIMLAGESGTAKSLFTSYLIKKYLDNKPNSKAIFFESEGSSTVDMARHAGIDEKKMIILPVMTIEETRTQMVKILDEIIEERKNDSKKQENFIFILDSIGMLSSAKETEDVASGNDKRDMTKAQLMKGFARVISLKLALCQSPFLIVAHTYATMDKYNPQMVGGGSAFRYMADIILVLSKTKAKEDGGKEQIGVEIRCKVEKSRYMQENKIVKLLLSFKHGLFKYSYLTELSKTLEIFKKEGMSYILPDGKKIKMKEMRVPKTSTPYFTDDVLKTIGDGIKKDFGFGDGE